MARNTAPAELAEHFRAIASKLERTVEDVACAYALLVALGSSPDPKADEILDALPVQHFEWGATFRDLIHVTMPMDNVGRFSARGISRQTFVTSSTTSTKTLTAGRAGDRDDSRKTQPGS